MSRSLSQLIIVAQASWNCSACFVECAETDAKCPACGTGKGAADGASAVAKTAADGGASAAVTQPPKKGSIWDKTAKKTSGWNCSACFVECDEKATKCPACGTTKPGGDSSASVSTDTTATSAKSKISFGTKQSDAGDAGKAKFSFGTTAKGGGSEGSGAKPKFGTNATASFGAKK